MLGIHEGYFVVKKLVWSVRIKAFGYTKWITCHICLPRHQGSIYTVHSRGHTPGYHPCHSRTRRSSSQPQRHRRTTAYIAHSCLQKYHTDIAGIFLMKQYIFWTQIWFVELILVCKKNMVCENFLRLLSINWIHQDKSESDLYLNVRNL